MGRGPFLHLGAMGVLAGAVRQEKRRFAPRPRRAGRDPARRKRGNDDEVRRLLPACLGMCLSRNYLGLLVLRGCDVSEAFDKNVHSLGSCWQFWRHFTSE